MAGILVYEREHVKIHYEEEVKAVYLEWQGFATSREFRQACEKSLEELESRGLSRMIADNRAAKAIAPTDSKWLSDQWFPRAITAGLRHSAVILSSSALNQHASNSISRRVKGIDFHAENFSEPEAARAWLASLEDC